MGWLVTVAEAARGSFVPANAAKWRQAGTHQGSNIKWKVACSMSIAHHKASVIPLKLILMYVPLELD